MIGDTRPTALAIGIHRVRRPVVQRLVRALSVRIPLNPAADSERIRPPLGAPRRRASVICLEWPTSVRFRQPFAHRFSFERDLREGSGNSDSVVSGSLASPKPPGGGEPEERGDEENTTESRSDL